MTGERNLSGQEPEGVLGLLVVRYRELADMCYRVSITRHGEQGRFQRGHRARQTHPALLKKVDLDRTLTRIYRRFFGSARLEATSSSTSTSNSRPQGSDTLTGPASRPASTWET